MAVINIEARIRGSSETQGAVVRQVTVVAVIRGSAQNGRIQKPGAAQ